MMYANEMTQGRWEQGQLGELQDGALVDRSTNQEVRGHTFQPSLSPPGQAREPTIRLITAVL